MDVLIGEKRTVESKLMPPGGLDSSMGRNPWEEAPDPAYHFDLGEIIGKKYEGYVLVLPVETVPKVTYRTETTQIGSHQRKVTRGVVRRKDSKTTWNVKVRTRKGTYEDVHEIKCAILNLTEKQKFDLEAKIAEMGGGVSLGDYAIW